MRGRTPQPTAIKLLQGNPGKRKLDERSEPAPPIELGEAPAYLDDTAKQHWMELGPKLVSLRTLGDSDRHVFAGMCINHSRVVYLSAKIDRIRRKRKIVPADEALLDKYESQRLKTLAAYNKTGTEFGLGAASRTRIKVTPDDGQTELPFGQVPSSPLERAMAASRSSA